MRALLGVALLGASAGLAVAQAGQTTLVVPPAPLLPAQLGDWVKDAGPPTDNAAQADDPVLTEAGLKRQERGIYHSAANPQQTIAVTAYQFVDATGAHSAYSYYQRPGAAYKGPKIGDETTNGFLFRSGTTLVSAESKLPVEQTAGVLRDLETHLPKVGGTERTASAAADVSAGEGIADGFGEVCAGTGGLPGDGRQCCLRRDHRVRQGGRGGDGEV